MGYDIGERIVEQVYFECVLQLVRIAYGQSCDPRKLMW
jgi:hypothetical protein